MMRKYKFVLVITITSLCMIITAFLYADRNISVENVSDTAWVIPYSSAVDLENDVDLVIEALIAPNTSLRMMDGSHGFPDFSYKSMQTDVNIQRVYKSNGKIERGQTLTILEPTFIEDNGLFIPGKTEYSSSLYRKALPGKRYLLFLSWDERHQGYWVHAAHQGKFNLDGKDQREREIVNKNEEYKRLRNSVMARYGFQ